MSLFGSHHIIDTCMNIKVNVIDLVISWVKNMIKGPLAFLKLLLVRSSEVLILLLLLELRIVYRTKHAHTNKQVQTIRNSTPDNINSTKRGY